MKTDYCRTSGCGFTEMMDICRSPQTPESKSLLKERKKEDEMLLQRLETQARRVNMEKIREGRPGAKATAISCHLLWKIKCCQINNDSVLVFIHLL